MNILGISAYYHDSAAVLLRDCKIASAAQEERFTRKKHDANFPKHAVSYCTQELKNTIRDVDYICFYDNPWKKFDRLLKTYLSYAPKGCQSFLTSLPAFLKEKLFIKATLKRELVNLFGIQNSELPPIFYNDHHHSHAASAFFPSPFQEAAVICLDGVGEWATSSVWIGEGNNLLPQWELRFPHSLGLLYSAFTYFTGFKVNSGEYKLMGLAPYGKPKYVNKIFENLVDLKDDGTFHLNMDYFDFATGSKMTNLKFDQLFNGPPRQRESKVTQREMDIACSIQVVTEEIVLSLAQTVHRESGSDYLCLAGGVALNCVANGRILRESPFKDIWIQPAAGDAGGALGAALSVWYEYLGKSRKVTGFDLMEGAYLGPKFTNEEIVNYLEKVQAPYQQIEDEELLPQIAKLLASENVVGWFQGRMEFGPRALGGRSILGDPRSKKMQSLMNLKIKYRESFRPFAPAVKTEKASEWFDIHCDSPYMLLVASIKKEKQLPVSIDQQRLFGIEKLNVPHSTIPAVTHVDYSARIQTVHPQTNPIFYKLLNEFEKRTGCPVLINTSFNVRGEPIVCSPKDAYRCFMRSEMDYLVLENCLLMKKDQPQQLKNDSWKNEFNLD